MTEPAPDPRTQVRVSVRLFSQEVAAAEADTASLIPARDPGYQFSNGRRFADGPGAAAPTLPAEG